MRADSFSLGFPDSSVGKESACNAGDPGLIGKIPWRRDRLPTPVFLGFPYGSAGEESTCNVGDLGSIPGLGRSPGEGKGYPLQYSGLENSMDPIVHRVANSQTRLSDFHFLFHCSMLWFPRQEYWGGLPFPSPGELPNPGIEEESHVSCIGRWVLYHWATWEAQNIYFSYLPLMNIWLL